MSGSEFVINKIKFETQKATENRNKPDFIFPSISKYHEQLYSEACLSMLAAKTSCKDRWRQILTEADRIKSKHLCTLDQTLTSFQTTEMMSKNVILVVPDRIMSLYPEQISKQMINTQSFINYIKDQQQHCINQ